MSYSSNCNHHNNLNGEEPSYKRRSVTNKVSVVLGAQWGDEGKGKVVDLLATTADIVCRVQVSKLSRNNLTGFWYNILEKMRIGD